MLLSHIAVLGSRRGRLLSENGGSVRDSASCALRISGYIDPPSQGSHTLTIYIPLPRLRAHSCLTCRCCTPPEQTLLSALIWVNSEKGMKELVTLRGKAVLGPPTPSIMPVQSPKDRVVQWSEHRHGMARSWVRPPARSFLSSSNIPTRQ